MTPKELARVYEKWCKAESITDEELRFAIPLLQDQDELLYALGDRFLFPAREMRAFLDSLRSFRDARKQKV